MAPELGEVWADLSEQGLGIAGADPRDLGPSPLH
jgi:hypothetical protein